MEGGEVHRLGAADHRNDQEPAAIGALDVHRQAQVHRARVHPVRLTIGFRVRVRHGALRGGRPNDRKTDQVREADLARSDLGVQLPPPRLEQPDVDVAEARRGRDRQRGRHVARQSGRRARDHLAASRCRGG